MVHLSRLEQKKERANIRDIALPTEVKNEIPFLPSRDISEERWKGMEEVLEGLKHNSHAFMFMATFMSFMDRDRVGRVMQGLGTHKLSTLFDEYTQVSKEQVDSVRLFDLAMGWMFSPRLLFMTYRENPNLEHLVKVFIHNDSHILNATSKVMSYFSFRLIDKEYTPDALPNTLQGELLREIGECFKKSDWFYFTMLLAMHRVLFPDDYTEPSANEWDFMKKGIEERLNFSLNLGDKSTAYDRYAEHTAWLSMLAASEIQIDDTGFRLIFDEPSRQTTSAQEEPPTARSF